MSAILTIWRCKNCGRSKTYPLGVMVHPAMPFVAIGPIHDCGTSTGSSMYGVLEHVGYVTDTKPESDEPKIEENQDAEPEPEKTCGTCQFWDKEHLKHPHFGKSNKKINMAVCLKGERGTMAIPENATCDSHKDR